MRIRDVMRSDLPTVSPEDSVGEAARRMWNANVKALPVCEGARLEGIITDWDVTCAVATGDAPERATAIASRGWSTSTSRGRSWAGWRRRWPPSPPRSERRPREAGRR